MDKCEKCAGNATHWVKDHKNKWWHTCSTCAREIMTIRKEINGYISASKV